MSKNSAIIKIMPQIDQAKMKQGIKQLTSLNKLSNIGKNLSVTGAKAVGAFSILSVFLSDNSKYLDNINDTMTDIIKKADSLSTINADLGSLSKNSGSFAVTSAVLESQGITAEGRDKLIASVQDNLATGKLKKGNATTLDEMLASLQKQWQEAKSKNDFTTRKAIEDIVGLRGKQASEFLQGNLASDKKDIQKLVGVSEEQLAQSIENNALLEGLQAKSLAVEELKMQNLLNEKVGTKGDSAIKSQVELEAFKKRMTLEMLGSFDKMAEAERTLLRIKMLATSMANSFLVGIKTSGKPEEIMQSVINSIIKVLSKVLLGLGSVLTILAQTLWSSITGKVFKENKTIAKNMKETNNQSQEATKKDLQKPLDFLFKK